MHVISQHTSDGASKWKWFVEVVRPEKALRYGWCIGSTRPPACRSAELQSIPCATHTAAADAVGPANRRLAQAPPAPIATAAAVDEAFINKSKEQARHQRLAALTLISFNVHTHSPLINTGTQ